MPKNILLINFGGIGDEILFLPAISSLKKTFSDAKITLCLEPRSKSIKDLTNIIDDVLLIDIKGKNKYFELFKLLKAAWGGHYDVVISSGGNKLISILLFLTGIKERYGFDSGFLSRILLTQAVKLDKNRYASKMYHELVSPITDVVTEIPQIDVGEVEKENNSNIFEGFSGQKDFEPEKEELEKTMDINKLNIRDYLTDEEFSSDQVEEIVTAPSSKEVIADSFINCSVLAFITAFIGAGWLINIINKIM